MPLFDFNFDGKTSWSERVTGNLIIQDVLKRQQTKTAEYRSGSYTHSSADYSWRETCFRNSSCIEPENYETESEYLEAISNYEKRLHESLSAYIENKWAELSLQHPPLVVAGILFYARTGMEDEYEIYTYITMLEEKTKALGLDWSDVLEAEEQISYYNSANYIADQYRHIEPRKKVIEVEFPVKFSFKLDKPDEQV